MELRKRPIFLAILGIYSLKFRLEKNRPQVDPGFFRPCFEDASGKGHNCWPPWTSSVVASCAAPQVLVSLVSSMGKNQSLRLFPLSWVKTR